MNRRQSPKAVEGAERQFNHFPMPASPGIVLLTRLFSDVGYRFIKKIKVQNLDIYEND
jgi:hypothetical protein